MEKGANDYESSAKVVDGNLIISLPDAANPVVWRMELGSVKASALEVRKNDATGMHVLTLKTPKGELHEVAPFETRDAAVTALMRVSAALQSAEGKIAPSIVAVNPSGASARPVFQKPDGSAAKWLLALAGVLVVIFLFSYLAHIAPDAETASSAPGEETATTITGEPNVENGEPQSADKMLRGF